MKAGRSGIDTIKSMDVTGYSTKIAGEVKDFDPAPYFKTPTDARRVDRFTNFAMGADGMALKDSGLDLEADVYKRQGCMRANSRAGWPPCPASSTPPRRGTPVSYTHLPARKADKWKK